MDIAELRRKARQEQAGEQKPAADANREEQEAAPSASAKLDEERGLVLEEHSEPEDHGEAALDKLFAGQDSLALVVADQDEEAAVTEEDAGIRRYLAFHLGREEYGLDIRTINEIIKVKEFTDVPRVPEFVLGIISLRGVIVPVYDLAQRLRLGVSTPTADARIIVCQAGELIVGLLVDDITQVVTLADEKIEPPPAVLTGLDRECMTGVGRYQGRMIILLHVENVLNVELT